MAITPKFCSESFCFRNDFIVPSKLNRYNRLRHNLVRFIYIFHDFFNLKTKKKKSKETYYAFMKKKKKSLLLARISPFFVYAVFLWNGRKTPHVRVWQWRVSAWINERVQTLLVQRLRPPAETIRGVIGSGVFIP